MAEWRYKKPLTDESAIGRLEGEWGFAMPASYVNTVKAYNGGRPPVGVFDTDITQERTIKSFLSLNSTDAENVYKACGVVSKIRSDVVPFGMDNFGNYICFNKADGKVVFLVFETGEIEFIAEDFERFLGIIAPKA